MADTKTPSAASAWEIAIKFRLGKLPTAANLINKRAFDSYGVRRLW